MGTIYDAVVRACEVGSLPESQLPFYKALEASRKVEEENRKWYMSIYFERLGQHADGASYFKQIEPGDSLARLDALFGYKKRAQANCRNCGAPPEPLRCSYCGSER